MMFSNKEEFKQQYAERMIKMYGRSLESAHITEQYLVLGEMIREYASIHWKKTKDQVAQKSAKQLYYFSMEFLIGRLMTNDRHVIRNRTNTFCIHMVKYQFAICILSNFYMPEEFNIHCMFWLSDFPDVADFQPLIWNFHLIAIDDFLFEQSILITDTVSVSRKLQ